MTVRTTGVPSQPRDGGGNGRRRESSLVDGVSSVTASKVAPATSSRWSITKQDRPIGCANGSCFSESGPRQHPGSRLSGRFFWCCGRRIVRPADGGTGRADEREEDLVDDLGDHRFWDVTAARPGQVLVADEILRQAGDARPDHSGVDLTSGRGPPHQNHDEIGALRLDNLLADLHRLRILEHFEHQAAQRIGGQVLEAAFEPHQQSDHIRAQVPGVGQGRRLGKALRHGGDDELRPRRPAAVDDGPARPRPCCHSLDGQPGVSQRGEFLPDGAEDCLLQLRSPPPGADAGPPGLPRPGDQRSPVNGQSVVDLIVVDVDVAGLIVAGLIVVDVVGGGSGHDQP
ncbi:hypothetical protein FAIPA1_160020 [Frankia sp. AiPs1]